MKLLACFLLSFALFAQSLTVSLKPASGWDLINFPGVSGGHPSNLKSGALAFNFPDRATGVFVDYLQYDYPFNKRPSMSGTLVATLQIVTTGTPVFMYDSESGNTCVAPATVRPYFEGRGVLDNRWWANPISYVLADGLVTLSVPLTPDQWSDVNGQAGTQNSGDFNGSLAVVGRIGFSFGGGCFFGHGVSVSGGTAQFQLLSYSVQ